MRRLLALLCILAALSISSEAQIPRVDVPGTRTTTGSGSGTIPDVPVTANQWIQGFSGGVATKTQPNFTNLAGSLSNAQMPPVVSAVEVLPRVVALTDGPTVTLDADTTDIGVLATLSQTTNFANPNGTPDPGQRIEVLITSASSQSLTFSTGTNGSFSAGVGFPTSTTGSGTRDRLMFEWVSSAQRWDLIASTIAPTVPPGFKDLPVQGAKLPSSNPAVIDGSENNYRLLFDASTSECAWWQFRMPSDYLSTPVLKVQYSMTSATSGGVSIDASMMAVTPGDAADINTDSYATVNNCDDAAVPGTAGFLDAISCSLTNNDSLAASDYTKIKLCRATADSSDTASGDMEVVTVTLEYTK